MNEVDICNMALSYCGSKPITSLENRTTTEENICHHWFAITRKECLVSISPNFARAREYINMVSNYDSFGFKNAYRKPLKCLKVLGISEACDIQNDYAIEGEYIQKP